MYPHRIRLRGPWECELLAPLQEGAERATARRVNMPCRFRDVASAGVAGRMLLRRRFGYPGRIDAHEQVWLTCAGLGGRAELRLNAQELGCCNSPACDFEITPLLKDRNVLELILETKDTDAAVWDEVALEIRCIS